MTVGIGAICEDGKVAVVAADKMVTFGAPMSLQTEPPTLKKISQLNDRTLLVFSGSTGDGEEIVTGAMPHITAAKQSVNQIAEAVKESYVQHKQRRAEETILKPWMGADFKQFQTLIAQSPSSQILQQVLMMISQHNLNTDFLVAGLDDSGAQVFLVTHPGMLFPLGKLTDLAIIQGEKISFASSALLKSLEEAHKEKPALSTKEQHALKEACNVSCPLRLVRVSESTRV